MSNICTEVTYISYIVHIHLISKNTIFTSRAHSFHGALVGNSIRDLKTYHVAGVKRSHGSRRVPPIIPNLVMALTNRKMPNLAHLRWNGRISPWRKFNKPHLESMIYNISLNKATKCMQTLRNRYPIAPLLGHDIGCCCGLPFISIFCPSDSNVVCNIMLFSSG